METLDLLVELGTEELPPRSVAYFSSRLQEGLVKALKAFVSPEQPPSHAWGTPRRHAVWLLGVRSEITSESQRVIGPPLERCRGPDGKWNVVAHGFLRKAQAVAKEQGTKVPANPDALDESISDDKGRPCLSYEIPSQTLRLADELPSLFKDLEAWISGQSYQEGSMRWDMASGEQPPSFIRPVRWLTVVLGDKPVTNCTMFGQTSSGDSRGHRQDGSPRIPIARAADYQETLRKNNILVDHDERVSVIREQARGQLREANAPNFPSDAEAQDLGIVARGHEAEATVPPLLSEVADLCEMPQVYLCRFNRRPLASANNETEVWALEGTLQRVIEEILRVHQKFFSIRSGEVVTSYFLAVGDGIKTDPEVVHKGFANVVRARIEDGQFLIEEDQKTSLEELGQGLDQIAFHPKLGSLEDKRKRVERVALLLRERWRLGVSEEKVRRAVLLCKADQLSQVVQEYPKLQGRIGLLYAQRDQEDEVIARAMFTHYLPRTAGDDFPGDELGTLLSVAERWESLLSLFAVGEKPSGRGDPLSMRRMVIGIWLLQAEKKWYFGAGEQYVARVREVYQALLVELGPNRTDLSDPVLDVIDALTTFQNQLPSPEEDSSPWPLAQTKHFSTMMKGTCPASFLRHLQILLDYEGEGPHLPVTLAHIKKRMQYWSGSMGSWENATLNRGDEKAEQGLHLALSKAIQVILSCGMNASSDVNNGWVDRLSFSSEEDLYSKPLGDVMDRVSKGAGYALASPVGYIKTILDAVVGLAKPVDDMLDNVRIEDSSLDPEVVANRKALMGAVAEFIERTVGLAPMGLSGED